VTRGVAERGNDFVDRAFKAVRTFSDFSEDMTRTASTTSASSSSTARRSTGRLTITTCRSSPARTTRATSLNPPRPYHPARGRILAYARANHVMPEMRLDELLPARVVRLGRRDDDASGVLVAHRPSSEIEAIACQNARKTTTQASSQKSPFADRIQIPAASPAGRGAGGFPNHPPNCAACSPLILVSVHNAECRMRMHQARALTSDRTTSSEMIARTLCTKGELR